MEDQATSRTFSPSMLITSQYHWFTRLVHAFGDHEQVLARDLRERMQVSDTHAQRILHDALLLGLIDRVGFGWTITMFGRQWLAETNEKPLPSEELLRTAALQVPFFADVHRQLPGVHDRQRLATYFAMRVPDMDAKDLGSARERYREAVYGAPMMRHERPQRKISTAMLSSHFEAPVNDDDLHRFMAYVSEYNELHKKYPPSFLRRYHASLFPERP